MPFQKTNYPKSNIRSQPTKNKWTKPKPWVNYSASKPKPPPTPQSKIPHSPQLDGVWEWDPITRKSVRYSVQQYQQKELRQMERWKKTHRLTKLGIWVKK